MFDHDLLKKLTRVWIIAFLIELVSLTTIIKSANGEWPKPPPYKPVPLPESGAESESYRSYRLELEQYREHYRLELEQYREQVEQQREVLEEQRADQNISLEEYRAEILLYNGGISEYRAYFHKYYRTNRE